MSWFKVDDKLHDHHKSNAAGKAAMGVWVMAGSWCADNMTDGFVPRRVLTRWGTSADARRLVQANLWQVSERYGEPGWQFVDWLDFNPSRASLEEKRERNAKKIADWRARKAAKREAE